MSKYNAIADVIDAHAADLPNEAPAGAFPGVFERTELTIDGLTVRFPASKPAALAVATKFRKGKAPPRSWSPPKLPSITSRAFSLTVLDTFIRDGEYDNATEYARLHSRELYFGVFGKNDERKPLEKATPLKQDPRFVVHRGGHESWMVTHIASGKAATKYHRTRVEAIDAFDAIDRAKLEAAIAPYHDNGADRPAHAENVLT